MVLIAKQLKFIALPDALEHYFCLKETNKKKTPLFTLTFYVRHSETLLLLLCISFLVYTYVYKNEPNDCLNHNFF